MSLRKTEKEQAISGGHKLEDLEGELNEWKFRVRSSLNFPPSPNFYRTPPLADTQSSLQST